MEEKFQREVDKRKKYKIKQKIKLERLKETMKRRKEKLSMLKEKKRDLKDKLRRSVTGELSQSFSLSPRKGERPSVSVEQSMSVSSKFFRKRSLAEGEREYSEIKGCFDRNEESDEEENKQLEQSRKARMMQNYRIARSRANSKEDKLIAVFQIISEQPSFDALTQLIKISPKSLNALQEEIFAYFGNDQEPQRDRLEALLLILEIEIQRKQQRSKKKQGISLQEFKEIVINQSRRNYPALGIGKARQLYFSDFIIVRLNHFFPEFISLPLLLYLLNLVKKEVEEIRERRIQRQVQQNQAQKEKRQLTKCQRVRIQCRNRNKQCVICVRSAFQWLMVKIIICCCFTGTDSKHKGLDSKEFSDEITQEEIESLRPSQRKKQKNIEHKPSPEWDELQDIIVQEIEQALHLYDPKKRLPWRCSASNIIVLLLKLLEFFSFLAFMWSSDISWNFSKEAQTSLVVINGETAAEYQAYFYFYGLSLTFALFYTFLVRPAAIKARNGTLGMRKNGLPAKCFTRPFLFSKTVQLLSASFYTFILKNLLDAFSCDFSQQPARLLRSHEIECFSKTHIGLMGGALVGILAYYPFATFLYSNLQFMNKDTDLKYNPQFMVYLAQAKLIFSSLSSFLHSSQSAIVVRLSLMACTVLFLAIQSARTSPCLVDPANKFHTAGYFSICYLILITILNVLKVSLSTVLGMMGGGLLVIWLITFLMKCSNRRKVIPRRESSYDLRM